MSSSCLCLCSCPCPCCRQRYYVQQLFIIIIIIVTYILSSINISYRKVLLHVKWCIDHCHPCHQHHNHHHHHHLLVAGVFFFFVLVPFLFCPLCFVVVFLAATTVVIRRENPSVNGIQLYYCSSFILSLSYFLFGTSTHHYVIMEVICTVIVPVCSVFNHSPWLVLSSGSCWKFVVVGGFVWESWIADRFVTDHDKW